MSILAIHWPNVVLIRAYARRMNGKIVVVRSHLRSLPVR